MKTPHQLNFIAVALAWALVLTTTAQAADALPSWNDGKTKQSIGLRQARRKSRAMPMCTVSR